MDFVTADFVPVLEIVRKLIEKFIMPSSMLNAGDQLYEVIDKILQLMICILDGLSCNHVTTLTELSVQWAPIFEMRNRRYLAYYFGMQIGGALYSTTGFVLTRNFLVAVL